MGLVHVHRHSEYSAIDGMGTADQYAEQAIANEQIGLGLTDHGTLGGALHHIKACRGLDDKGKRIREPVIPLVGVEAYFRHDRTLGKGDDIQASKAMHLCLHAASMNGWRSLLRLTSEAYTTGDKTQDGYYGKPCIDWDVLERNNEGLFCSTACVYGPVNDAILRGDEGEAKDNLEGLLNIFGDRLWMEIMPHDWEPQRVANMNTINFAQRYGIPLLATGDAHMPYKEWCDTHRIYKLHAVRQTFNSARKSKEEKGEDVYGDSEMDTLYLSSEQEMLDMFAENHDYIPTSLVQEAIDNTEDMVRKTRLYVVNRDQKLPRTDVDDAESTLYEWVQNGIERIAAEWYNTMPEEHALEREQKYREQAEYEFEVLKTNDVIDYFVIVGDLVRWCKSTAPLPEEDEPKKPIRVGLGRGSAAGCLISYLIGITGIDPLAYGLMFERFLNPDRKGLPDIDLDFDADRRWMVKEYLGQKYGKDHVADIIAMTRFAPRAVIDDVGRVYDIPFAELDKVKETIGDLERDIVKVRAKNPVLDEFAEKYPDVWKHMERLDGQIHRPTKHAAGVVITDRPIDEYMPLQLNKSKKGNSIVTGWSDAADFPIISDFGFLKLDALGVMDLTRQEHAVDLLTEEKINEMQDDDMMMFARDEEVARNAIIALRQKYAHEIDPAYLEILRDPEAADPKVLQAFADGLTIGVFQFGGRGITQLLKKIRPDKIGDVIAANALYRPGAMKVAFDYADRKHGRVPEEDWYWHPAVEPFLKETYGVLTYQEQVMQLVRVIGGFSGGQADSMRKAMSKLYRLPGDQAQQFMQQFKDTWDAGCAANGIEEEAREIIWAQILDNGDYSFNKSHSASYALQAYQDMWLKVNHPLEFYAAILSRPSKEKGFVERAVREAKLLKVPISAPDVNRSRMAFSVYEETLLYGLIAVRDIGDSAARDIINERNENGEFESYEDFAKRLSQHAKKAGMPLIRAGGFDSIEDRSLLLSTVEKNVSKKKQEELLAEGLDMPRQTVAEHINHNRTLKNPRPIPEDREVPSALYLREQETEMLGASINTSSPAEEYAEILSEYVFTEQEFDELEDGDDIVVAGEISRLTERKTKKGDPFAFVDLSFKTDEFSLTLWTPVLARYRSQLDTGSIIVFGEKNVWNGRSGIVAKRIQDIETFVRETQSAAD